MRIGGLMQTRMNIWRSQLLTKRGWANLLADPQKLFILMAAIFGIAMALLLPIFMAPDETAHFQRAYQVGSGHLLSTTVHGKTGGVVPPISGLHGTHNPSIAPIPPSHYFIKPKPGDIHFRPFPTTAQYSPVAYIPQAIGVDIGRLIYPSVGVMALTGRLANLAAYIVLICLAIRIATRGKWVYAVVALFPVAIQQAASLSTDVMTIGLDFVTIAFMQRLFFQKTLLQKKQLVYLVLLALGLSLTKQTNILLLLPLLFLPRRLFTDRVRGWVVRLGIIAFSAVVALGWYAVVKLLHYETDYSSIVGVHANVQPIAQLKFILTHPLGFAKTLFKTYIFEGFHAGPLADFYWTSMYGYFSFFFYKLPVPFISLGYSVLLVALLYRSKDESANEGDLLSRFALIQTAVFALSVVAVGVALYMVWSTVAETQVAGIQGRYFIPIMPLLVPLFVVLGRWVKVTLAKPHYMGVMVMGIYGINLSAMLAITFAYFYR